MEEQNDRVQDCCSQLREGCLLYTPALLIVYTRISALRGFSQQHLPEASIRQKKTWCALRERQRARRKTYMQSLKSSKASKIQSVPITSKQRQLCGRSLFFRNAAHGFGIKQMHYWFLKCLLYSTSTSQQGPWSMGVIAFREKGENLYWPQPLLISGLVQIGPLWSL